MNNHLEFSIIGTGKPFPYFKEQRKSYSGVDGSSFEALPDNNGYIFSLFLNQPVEEEIETFGNRDIQIKIFKEDIFVLPIINFGDQLLYEIIFDPTLYDDERALQFVKYNNILNLYLIDSSDFIVKAIRSANLPLRFIQICNKVWTEAMKDEEYSRKYKQWVQELQGKYKTSQLWNQSEDCGKLGESYDLSDI